jgi:hypothetical protein
MRLKLSEEEAKMAGKQLRRHVETEKPGSIGLIERSLTLLNLWTALGVFQCLVWPGIQNFSSEEVCRYISVLVPGELMVIDSIHTLPGKNEWRRFNILTLLNELQRRKIGTVIRVSEREYQDIAAEKRGIASVSCEYDDPTPDPGVVNLFFYTMRTRKGAMVAIHNDGAHGRAATLCALHLMAAHALTAEAAMATIRDKCPSLLLSPHQSAFLIATDRQAAAAVAAAAASHDLARPADRLAALRRGLFRAWAAEYLPAEPLGAAGRPESPYEAPAAAAALPSSRWRLG